VRTAFLLILLTLRLTVFSHPPRPELVLTLTADKQSYAPGATFIIPLQAAIPEGYHLYSNPLVPHDTQGVLHDTLTVSGIMCKASCIQIAHVVPFQLTVSGHDPQAPFARAPQVAATLAEARPMPLDTREGVDEGSQENGELVSEETPAWDFDPVSGETPLGLGLALVLAFLAGVILNVMPCVLPVLGIKVLSLAQGHHSRRQALISSLAFAAGMIAVFMALASLAAFAGFSWGQQFQKPAFLAGIVCFMFFFALGMFDMYLLLVPSSVGQAERSAEHGLGGDFLRGVFATVLATPCSGPFLGATLAWALAQPPLTIYAVFLSLGAGMASPYVLLALSKRLLAMVPKPGQWMEDFKHLMGFLLIGFAIYLMIGLPRDMVLSTVGLCAFVALAIKVFGRVAPFGVSVWRTLAGLVAAAATFAAGIYLCFGVLYQSTSDSSLARAVEEGHAWEEFTPEALVEAIDNGQDVMVDFTANWCMNCQYNMIAVLQSERVRERIEQTGTVTLVADLTSTNPAAEALLHHLGSRSVPFLAVFPAQNSQQPVIMRDVLNRRALLRVLDKLR